MEAHGTISNPQHRVQAPGGAGLSGGRELHSLTRRHDLARNLIRIWIQKFEAGALDDEAIAGLSTKGHKISHEGVAGVLRAAHARA